METQRIEKDGCAYIELLPDGWLMDSETAALDLVGACGEYYDDRLLLHAASLPEAFFDLKTRLAGDVLLKFSNYAIRVAAVIPPERIGTGRFAEFVQETNRGSAFRVFETHDAASDWLLSI